MEIGILLVGLLAGVLSGLFGIGGGIVMVPMLVAFFGMNILDANAASLGAMLLPVGVFGVINYYKAGLIHLKESLWISLGLFLGSFLGAEITFMIDISLLAKLYALFLLYVALLYFNIPALLFKKKKVATNEVKDEKKHAVWEFLLLGLFAGVIAGMFGKGGGIIIVPLLVAIFKYKPIAASATSLAALQLPVGLPSVLVYAENGHLNLLYAALMAIGIVLGAFFGSKAALKLSSVYFKRIYAFFLLGVAIYMVIKYI
ncbi:MAG: sulfite exporter TauE/SafE family protein [Paludibacteraceae bacterium]|nr:sulfite exporter TauE/SafE family protein [Paludibacteraceae bacterium]